MAPFQQTYDLLKSILTAITGVISEGKVLCDTEIVAGTLATEATLVTVNSKLPEIGVPRLTSAVVSAASAGDNTLVAASPGNSTYCYKLLLVFAGATTVVIKRGSTALTGTMSFGEGGSLVLDFDGEPWYSTNDNEALVMTLGSAVQVSGSIHYVTE